LVVHVLRARLKILADELRGDEADDQVVAIVRHGVREELDIR
jgi:hypothetical protein